MPIEDLRLKMAILPGIGPVPLFVQPQSEDGAIFIFPFPGQQAAIAHVAGHRG